MIDFDGLVLNKCEDIFSILVRFTPLVSDPGAPAFECRGIYSSGPVDVQMQDETIFSRGNLLSCMIFMAMNN
jgi:hypothetical protein